jgi:tRNA-splicing ligase RtcB
VADGAAVRVFTDGPLGRDVATALDRLSRGTDVVQIAVMPDVHLAADVCIGTVVATTHALYPNAVGGDIGCGVAALAFDVEAARIGNARTAAAILAGLYRAVPVIRHVRGRAPDWPASLGALSAPALAGSRTRETARQLGTLGRGNHFVELQADEEGRLWLMLHSGSRGIGQAIRDHHLAAAVPGANGLRFLDAESPRGREYLHDVAWALAYADASRRAMVAAVCQLLEDVLGAAADEATYASCDHNHVRREEHGGAALWIHRKGAIRAASGTAGLIPGSMGTHSFHVTGRGHEGALCSSAHGAGRRLSRTDARRSVSVRDVHRQLHGVWFDHRQAASLREEAPAAYKDVDTVMRAQRDLVRIVRRLRPILSFKGA